MEIGEIISDAIRYPLNHTKSLLIYIVIMFVIALIALFTGVGLIAGQQTNQVLASGVIGIIGLILIICIGFLVYGYGLDIVKLGIDKSDAAPEIDIGRQVIAGLKYLIVAIVYSIIPIIVIALLSAINNTLGTIVGVILLIIFGLVLLMGECRLANTESLGAALNIPEAVKDINNVGVVKVLAVSIVLFVLAFILDKILLVIANILGPMEGINFIYHILAAICVGYLFFFAYRAIGLMYADNDA